jgi:hypothetical protein
MQTAILATMMLNLLAAILSGASSVEAGYKNNKEDCLFFLAACVINLCFLFINCFNLLKIFVDNQLNL